MNSMLPAVFVASLIGSVHCAGMCGPFLSLYSANSKAIRFLPHLLYNFGRLASYLVLGTAAGFLGAGIDAALLGTGVLGAAGVFAGLALVAWGLTSLIGALGFASRFAGRIRLFPSAGILFRVVKKVNSFGLRFPPPWRAFFLGLATAFLPCGWLWAFVLVAAGSGAMLSGAGTMFAFWLGTVPIMATLGVGLRGFFSVVGLRLRIVTSILLIVAGWLTVAGRLQVHLEDLRASTSNAEATAQTPQLPTHTHRAHRLGEDCLLPCCREK